MDYDFFKNLSEIDATKFLNNFLDESKDGFQQTATKLQKDGIVVDYTIDSIIPVYNWVLEQLKTIPLEIDDSLPDWIKQSDDYLQGLFEFNEESAILTLRAAYYLGESFNRSSQELFWTTGDNESALKNMPVVNGFKYNLELAPLLVSENLFKRIIQDNSRLTDIKTALDSWLKNIPE